MASKKRSGEGSNMGLIITLVFFVLSTVILGVTTYVGYSGLEEKEKAKAKAVDDAKKKDAEALYYRFAYNVVKAYADGSLKPTGVTPAELAEFKKQLDQGTLTFASANAEDSAALKGIVAGYDKTMPWRNTDVPSATFASRLLAADQAYTAQGKLLADARRQQADEKLRADQAREDADKAAKAFNDKMTVVTKLREKDLDDVGTSTKKAQADANAANEEKNAARLKETELAKDLATMTTEKKRFESDLLKVRREMAQLRDDYNDKVDRLRELKDKYAIDEKKLDASVLDAAALKELRRYNKDWRIVDVDRKGNLLYINLGSADKLQPQITFSVHERGTDGKLNPAPKGTVEVISVRGPKLSQVRVTSLRTPPGLDKTGRMFAGEPLVKGDYLFNPTWDPTRSIRVAVAGVVDLNEDRTDGTDEFYRMLKRQNVEVDSGIDVRDDKAPKATGAGITARTDYVVVADNLEQINHPKFRDKVYRDAFDALVKDMKTKASANAVPVISIRQYLDMIGYRAPKATPRTADR